MFNKPLLDRELSVHNEIFKLNVILSRVITDVNWMITTNRVLPKSHFNYLNEVNELLDIPKILEWQ